MNEERPLAIKERLDDAKNILLSLLPESTPTYNLYLNGKKYTFFEKNHLLRVTESLHNNYQPPRKEEEYALVVCNHPGLITLERFLFLVLPSRVKTSTNDSNMLAKHVHAFQQVDIFTRQKYMQTENNDVSFTKSGVLEWYPGQSLELFVRAISGSNVLLQTASLFSDEEYIHVPSCLALTKHLSEPFRNCISKLPQTSLTNRKQYFRVRDIVKSCVEYLHNTEKAISRQRKVLGLKLLMRHTKRYMNSWVSFRLLLEIDFLTSMTQISFLSWKHTPRHNGLLPLVIFLTKDLFAFLKTNHFHDVNHYVQTESVGDVFWVTISGFTQQPITTFVWPDSWTVNYIW